MDALRRRWHAPGGYQEFLHLAFPLILSSATWSLQHFVDRVFLTWYSTDALAAAYPAGMSNFVFISLFMGVAQYINTFVAQYSGARRPERVGPAVWQGVYLSLIGLVAGLAVAGLAQPLFDFIGHDSTVRAYEVTYFRVLCYGVGPIALSTAGSCFFSGRGKTWTVLGVNAVATVLNIVLNYGLIFGAWGLPAWGIRGAAWATNLTAVFSAVFFFALILRRPYRQEYATLSGWKLDPELFRRLLRFGGPSGVNFMLDILAFTFFILIVGRIGILELAATNLAFNINGLAFIPLIGGGIAVSTMVGQRLGDNDPATAEYATWTSFYVAAIYMAVMALAYLLVPELFLSPYGARSQSADFPAVHALAVNLLRLVAVYCIFDASYIVFSAALKGAGDTRYVMWVSVVLSWLIMVLPPIVGVTYFGIGVYGVWAFMCVYVILVSVIFYFRFRAGKWKGMRVIEEPAVP